MCVLCSGEELNCDMGRDVSRDIAYLYGLSWIQGAMKHP